MVELIPFTEEYVPTFNKWLQDPEMQQLVATEPLSLEAEYEFQRECSHSTDKMIKLIRPKVDDAPIIGDVDFFFDGDGNAEVNIMIAPSEWRRHGYASEAIILAMQYAIKRFDIKRFIAKIGKNNTASIKFFERHGFKSTDSNPNVFDEFVYVMDSGDVPYTDLEIKSTFDINV